MTMALIKVKDLAYGRLRAPDLDLMEEFRPVIADSVVLNNAGAMSLGAASLSGFERLTKQNTGVATLTGLQSYSAGTVLSAGTLLVEGQKVSPRSLVMGSLGRVKRLLTQAEVADIQLYADRYVGYRLDYM